MSQWREEFDIWLLQLHSLTWRFGTYCGILLEAADHKELTENLKARAEIRVILTINISTAMFLLLLRKHLRLNSSYKCV